VSFRPDFNMKAPRLSDLPRSGPLFFCDLVQKHKVLLVVTSQDRSIFVLHTRTAKVLQHLENIHALRYQITVKPNDLLQGAEPRHDQCKEGDISTNVYIYGDRSLASSVGATLSKMRVFLQDPEDLAANIQYENPHYYDVPQPKLPLSESTSNEVMSTNTGGPGMEQDVLKILDSLDSSDKLEEAVVSVEIMTDLLRLVKLPFSDSLSAEALPQPPKAGVGLHETERIKQFW